MERRNEPWSPSWDTIIRCGLRDARESERMWRHGVLTRLLIVVLSVVLAVLLSVAWWTGPGARRRDDADAVASCVAAVDSMRDGYDRAVEARGRAADAFASMDSSRYDLDALSKALEGRVAAPPSLSCASSPDSVRRRADRLASAYRVQADGFSAALGSGDGAGATRSDVN